MSKIYVWPTGNIDPKAMLEKAKEVNFKELIICGFTDKDELVLLGSSDDIPNNHFLACHAVDAFMSMSLGTLEIQDDTVQ